MRWIGAASLTPFVAVGVNREAIPPYYRQYIHGPISKIYIPIDEEEVAQLRQRARDSEERAQELERNNEALRQQVDKYRRKRQAVAQAAAALSFSLEQAQTEATVSKREQEVERATTQEELREWKKKYMQKVLECALLKS